RRPGGGGGRRKFKQLNLPPESFMHTGVALKEVSYDAPRSYNEFPLQENLAKNLERLGWTNPTEIQDKTFEAITELRDVLGIANTGTGKTGAFLIPLINAMLMAEDDFSALVMVPTRELALQVEEEFKQISRGLQLYAACFIGGTSVDRDVRKLQKPFHFVIGTPGRLV